MAKKKLIRFREMEGFPNVVQPNMDEFWETEFKLKGKWGIDFFRNSNPIVLELACGKGEYAVNMAKKYPNKNFLGVDIKGARIWYGAHQALAENVKNVGFLRARIDFIDKFFAESEISEIWITFPDPQPQESRERKRLIAPIFIDRYKKFLEPYGLVNLKTDADSFFDYTLAQIKERNYRMINKFENIYNQQNEIPEELDHLYTVKTHYEGIFSAKGHTIKYVSFKIH